MKKILLVLSILALLTGCGATDTNTKVDTVTVSLYKGVYEDLLSDEIKEKLYDIGLYLTDSEIGVIGEKMPNLAWTDYDGKELTLPNESYIIEIVGSWCQYCQALASESNNDILALGYPVYQYFLYGTPQDVDDFYETIGTEKPNNIVYLMQNEEFDDFLIENDFVNIPMTLVIDGNGRIALTRLGYAEKDDVVKFVEMAMEAKFYDLEVEGTTLYDFIKTQKIAKKYIEELEEIEIPKELFN